MKIEVPPTVFRTDTLTLTGTVTLTLTLTCDIDLQSQKTHTHAIGQGPMSSDRKLEWKQTGGGNCITSSDDEVDNIVETLQDINYIQNCA